MNTHAASNRRQTRTDSATRPGLRSGKNVPAREKKKDDLSPEHQRALKRLDQMTEWKDTLAKENAVLRKENKGLKGDLKEARGEVERLAARYEDAWREKALLEERISVREI
jgi:archaellum component FlaC